MANSETIVVTGAAGQLGRLVITELQKIAPGARIVALVRNPSKAQDLAARGVELRTAAYDDAAAVTAAVAGADKVLLISGSEVGKRIVQHRNVIDAAKAAGVKLLAYTSILRADTNPMALAAEHLATEQYLRASGVPFVFLRNGWYNENYTMNMGPALQYGAVMGAARDGRISAAARADYAAAAAVVMASDAKSQAGKSYELAGDNGFTMAEYAAELALQSGKPVVYNDMPEAGYKAALQGVGLPEAFARILADSDAKAAGGSLHDSSGTLKQLIGRPTTPLAASIAAAIAAA